MIEITSVNNDLIKEISKLQQKKYRTETKLFLLEGYKAIEETDVELEYILVKKDAKIPKKNCKEIILTTDAVLKKVASTDTPPEIIAVGVQKKFSKKDIKDARQVLLLENIKDLGNLGTILRTSLAFNIDAIILYGETVDLYNPKCVRASVGNFLKIPVLEIKNIEELSDFFKDFEKIATLPHSEKTEMLSEFTPKIPYLLMFGSEAMGLSDELIGISDKKLTIEMSEKVESLNLSMSVGIVLYKFTNISK